MERFEVVSSTPISWGTRTDCRSGNEDLFGQRDFVTLLGLSASPSSSCSVCWGDKRDGAVPSSFVSAVGVVVVVSS